MKHAKKIAASGALLGASVAGGIAFAAWTADGTGSGYAQAKTAGAVSTVSAAADTVAQLYPGSSGDVKVSITNPNDYAVRVTAISGNGTITSASSACNASHGVTFGNRTGTWDIPAKSEGTLVTLSGAVAMSNDSVTACAGQTFTVPVAITGASHVPTPSS